MKVLEYLARVNRDEERKPYVQIAWEVAHCALLEREPPYYYFTSLLHKRDADDYRTYVGHRKIFRIVYKEFFKYGRNEDLNDKVSFGHLLTASGIETPRVLAVSQGQRVQVEGESIFLESPSDLTQVVAALSAASRGGSIFVKPIGGVGGKDSFKFTPGLTGEFGGAEGLFALLCNGGNFVFQEAIVQHHAVSAIYPISLNTLRIHTLLDRRTNEVEVVTALMRFGSGGHIVDNGSSGGMFVAVDIANWELRGVAKSYLKSGGKIFKSHPDSQTLFDGVKLPFKDEVLSLVKDTARLFQNEFVGWDVALTEDGPTVIEGNDDPHLIMAQMASGGFKAHPRYREIFARYV